MEKNIWVLNNNRKELIEAQQLINSNGALRTICLFSYDSVINSTKRQLSEGDVIRPSLIILDYNMELNENFKTLYFLQEQSVYAGVPVVFMVNKRNNEVDEECYKRGATVVVEKPFSSASIVRIERMAWQYEKSRNYEKILQRQISEINTARQIKILNGQLESRNELLHQIFGRYFSNEVVSEILENPRGASIGGDKKELTVMMADLRGFTSISEKLEADKVTDMINHFLEKMTEIIFEFHGSIIEFIGDAILAVFGAPIEKGSSQEDAISAAIVMQNSMKEVNEFNIENNYPIIKMGIGINKGEVFIGNIGSEKMMRYNIIGNTVNLASRIENCSKGGQILVSEQTLENIHHKVNVKNIFMIKAKGISKEIKVNEVIGINKHLLI